MQVGSGWAPARQDERLERRKLLIEAVNLALKPRHLRLADSQPRAARPLADFRWHAEIGPDVEQIILDARERRIECAITYHMQARDADHGVDLIERAIGLDAQVEFLAPLAGAERRGAVIAAAGIDPVEDDHSAQRPIAQIAIMMMMIATNCISTRSRISFCDV